MRVTRRGALLTAGGGLAAVGGGALIESGVLPGRSRARRLLGLEGAPGVDLPDVDPGPVRRGTLDGAAWVVCEPPGGGHGLPVVLAFHGASYDVDDLVTSFGVGRFLAASGERFVIAAIDDLDLSLTRLRPQLTEMGYDARRPGLLGWSRGGYACLQEAVSQPDALAAVALASPALTGDDAFADDAARLRGLPVRIDCGRQDPFYAPVTAFADRLAGLNIEATVSFEPGAHTVSYWTSVLPDQLTWLGARV